MNLPDWFTDRIDFDIDGCWLWTGARNSRGYGVLRYDYRYAYAHRVAYTWLVDPASPIYPGVPGTQLDHLCCVKRCVNPTHLEPVTNAENCRRHWARVRLAMAVA